jgi:hypothetical protein
MPLTRIDRGYLLVAAENLTDRIRLKGMLHWNPFETIPEILNYLLLPNMDCVFIVSESPTDVLAEKLRKTFPNVVFIITPIHEVDGLLPEAAWAVINGTRGPEQ